MICDIMWDNIYKKLSNNIHKEGCCKKVCYWVILNGWSRNNYNQFGISTFWKNILEHKLNISVKYKKYILINSNEMDTRLKTVNQKSSHFVRSQMKTILQIQFLPIYIFSFVIIYWFVFIYFFIRFLLLVI